MPTLTQRYGLKMGWKWSFGCILLLSKIHEKTYSRHPKFRDLHHFGLLLWHSWEVNHFILGPVNLNYRCICFILDNCITRLYCYGRDEGFRPRNSRIWCSLVVTPWIKSAGDATNPCSSEGASSCLGCSCALRYLVGVGGAGFWGGLFWAVKRCKYHILISEKTTSAIQLSGKTQFCHRCCGCQCQGCKLSWYQQKVGPYTTRWEESWDMCPCWFCLGPVEGHKTSPAILWVTISETWDLCWLETFRSCKAWDKSNYWDWCSGLLHSRCRHPQKRGNHRRVESSGPVTYYLLICFWSMLISQILWQ